MQQDRRIPSKSGENTRKSPIHDDWRRAKVVTGIEETIDEVTFSGKFCSGNLAKVKKMNSGEFRCWTSPDCAGSEWETTYTTWFYFSVKAKKGVTVRLCVANMNKQLNLYKHHDMRPIYKVEPAIKPWQRMPEAPTFKAGKENLQLKFRYRFETDKEKAYFAFCFPISYEDVQARLFSLDKLYFNPHSTEPTDAAAEDDIYYYRELLVKSHDGNRMDLVTISARNGLLNEREDFIEEEASILHPDRDAEPRPFKFEPYKKVCFLTARVHPGETPGSWAIEGAMRFLLSRDPRAFELRRRFVWKIIPLLNPDGVARGHYRADTRGVNLNRVYHQPCPALHPTIYATKLAIVQIATQGRLALYIDMHAHASKRGCFLMGNYLENADHQVENLLYARLACSRSPHLEYSQCSFSKKSMVARDKREGLSKEGSGRVGIYNASGRIPHCYTLECNYNRGRENPRPYTRDSWLEVGRSLCMSMLDLIGVSERVDWGLPELVPPEQAKLNGQLSHLKLMDVDKDNEDEVNEEVDLLLQELEEAMDDAGDGFDDDDLERLRQLISAQWAWKGPATDVSLVKVLRQESTKFLSLPVEEQLRTRTNAHRPTSNRERSSRPRSALMKAKPVAPSSHPKPPITSRTEPGSRQDLQPQHRQKSFQFPLAVECRNCDSPLSKHLSTQSPSTGSPLSPPSFLAGVDSQDTSKSGGMPRPHRDLHRSSVPVVRDDSRDSSGVEPNLQQDADAYYRADPYSHPRMKIKREEMPPRPRHRHSSSTSPHHIPLVFSKEQPSTSPKNGEQEGQRSRLSSGSSTKSHRRKSSNYHPNHAGFRPTAKVMFQQQRHWKDKKKTPSTDSLVVLPGFVPNGNGRLVARSSHPSAVIGQGTVLSARRPPHRVGIKAVGKTQDSGVSFHPKVTTSHAAVSSKDSLPKANTNNHRKGKGSIEFPKVDHSARLELYIQDPG